MEKQPTQKAERQESAQQEHGPQTPVELRLVSDATEAWRNIPQSEFAAAVDAAEAGEGEYSDDLKAVLEARGFEMAA